MEYDEYFARFQSPPEQILRDWRWLIGERLQLWKVTIFGDAFIRDPENGAIHFLDHVEGAVERVADNEADLTTRLSTGKAAQWLMCGVVDGQKSLGMSPGENQCLSFKQPPVLGGKLKPSNFEITDIPTHFSIAGQIHRQVKDLPDGAKIKDIVIEAPGAAVPRKRPWWRFW